MLRSMTAFARRELQGEWGVLAWELRAVNHRYLELALRLPEELRALEGVVRERLTATLGRGKVDAALRFQAGPAQVPEIELNQPLLQQLLRTCRELDTALEAAAPLNPLDVLRWPGLVNKVEPDLQPLQAAALSLLDETITEFILAREREGARLGEMLEQRCAGVSALVGEVRQRLPEVLAALREKLLARLAELPVNAEPGRLEQELVLQAQKLDVAEELDRLDSHVVELREALGRSEPVGRRLDFLMQEFNREANTLGSKSADAMTTRAAVELKVLIEQMREQIQNIE